jgi:hypothetical protein
LASRLGRARRLFDAGNARTLEESFDAEFAGHYGVFDKQAPSAEDIQDLVSYLLAIDETGATATLRPPIDEIGFDPDLCAQFKGANAGK